MNKIKIILFPAGGRISQANYERLVKNGVKIDLKNNQFIEDNSVTETLHLWGVTNGGNGSNSTKFGYINEGDIALFVAKDKVISYGVISHKLPHNKELAKVAINDEVWENIVILSSFQEKEIDVIEINKLIGYSENYRIQGFTVLNPEKSEDIIKKYNLNAETLQSSDNGIIKLIEEKEKENIDIFISYSHEDEHYQCELKKHLSILRYTHKVNIWDDLELEIGDDFNDKIFEKIDTSSIIIVLISSDYFNSDYCINKEWPYIKKNHRDKVVPVILRNCLWNVMLEGMYTITLPKNSRNIFESTDHDKEYKEIAEVILNKIIDLRNETA